MIFQQNFEYVLDPVTGKFITFKDISNYDDPEHGLTRASFPTRRFIIRDSDDTVLDSIDVVNDEAVFVNAKDRYLKVTFESIRGDGVVLTTTQKIPAGRIVELLIMDKSIQLDWMAGGTGAITRAIDAIYVADRHAASGNGVLYDKFITIANRLVNEQKC